MNQKHFIGKRVTNLELYDEIGPISGVALIVDDEHEIFAGDETGYVLEMECPYATEAMAEAALAKAKNHTYKGYSAENASLGIGAELGDGITIGGIYSMLAHQKLAFGAGHLSDIAAPGDNEVDHEYPYLSPLERTVRRNKANAYSLISKTAEEIQQEVRKLETSVNGTLESYSTRTQTAEDITDAVKGFVNGNQVSASIQTALKGITLEASSADGTTTFVIKGGEVVLASKEINLTVDAANISGNVHLGGLLTVYDGPDSDKVGGYLGYDDGFNSEFGIGIRSYEGGNGPQIVCTNQAARISYSASSGSTLWQTGVTCEANSLTLDAFDTVYMRFGRSLTTAYGITMDSFYPAVNDATLGTSNDDWADVYAAGTSFSALAASVAKLVGRVAALEAK